MRYNYTQNKVSICKKDVCLNIYGEAAKFVGATIGIAIFAYGISQIAKSVR